MAVPPIFLIPQEWTASQPAMAGWPMGRILLVDDEPGTLRSIASRLEADGNELWQGHMEKALELMSSHTFDAILTEQTLMDGGGLKILSAARESDPSVSVVFLTPEVGSAAAAIDEGAFDFLAKPSAPDVVLLAARRACEHTLLRRKNLLLESIVEHSPSEYEIYGETAAMREVRQSVSYVGPTNSPVLITGESGTGKEVVARAVHRHSLRVNKPLLSVNCSGMYADSLEHRLFGDHAPAKRGLLEAANQGTIYLKGIEALSLAAQERLVPGLTQGRLSGTTRTDVRLIASSHCVLEERVKEGSFRRDLLQALDVVHIHLPPLRERKADIGLLCTFFSQRTASKLGLKPRNVSSEAMAKIQSYNFPGNVNELRNLIERAYMLATEGEIGPDDLLVQSDGGRQSGDVTTPEVTAAVIPEPSKSFDLLGLLKETEQVLIRRTLESTGGSQAEAARRMGISRSLLSYKINKYGIRMA
jgi:two-component system NtrC family response regulator